MEKDTPTLPIPVISCLTMEILSALLFSFVLFWPTIFILFSRYGRSGAVKLPPGPFAWPIVRNLFQIDPKKPHIALAELAKSYGPLMSLRLGSRLFVVASSPETAREIYKTHDKELSGRYVPHMSKKLPEGNSGIAVSDPADQNWRFVRGTVHTALFSPQALESRSQLRVDKAQELVDYLCSKDGKLVNITDIVYATIVNTWTRLLVYKDFIQSWDKVGEMRTATRELVEFAIPGLTDLFPALSWLDYVRKLRIENYTIGKGTMWGEILQGRRVQKLDNSVASRDYMDVLINKSVNDDQINNLLTELLVTAETVAIAVEWVMAELIKNQETFKTLGKELDDAVNGGILQEGHLTKLPYLQAVIKEALRLHPPTPLFLPRKATQSCEVMNYEIPKDCLVLVNLYAVATDPTAWEDPLSFKPERFLGKNLDVKGTNYELLPFGAGRRICSGYPLALKEMQLLIAALVHAFHWSVPSGKDPANLDMTEYFGTTLGLKKPLQLIPKTKNQLMIQGL